VRRRGQPPPGGLRRRGRARAPAGRRARSVAAEVNDGFAHGGPGAADLAHAVEACEQPNSFDHLYALDVPIKQKIETVATRVYGAGEVTYAAAAERKIEQFTANGLDGLPVCMAKTPLSLSADPALLGAPADCAQPTRPRCRPG